MMLSPRSRNPQERIPAADLAYGGQIPEARGNQGFPLEPPPVSFTCRLRRLNTTVRPLVSGEEDR
jgi:hypothetical protein